MRPVQDYINEIDQKAEATESRIVRLNSESLFSSENYDSIKVLLEKAAEKGAVERECYDLYRDVNYHELSLIDKKVLLDFLDKTKLISIQSDGESLNSDNIYYVNDAHEYVSLDDMPSQDENKVVGALHMKNAENSFSAIGNVNLNQYIYHPHYDIILLDHNEAKCPPINGLHERIHYLDNKLSGVDSTVSGLAVNQLSLSSAPSQPTSNAAITHSYSDELLQKTMKSVIKSMANQGNINGPMSEHYGAVMEGHSNGRDFAASEMLTFMIQGKVERQQLHLEPDEVAVARDVMTSFQNSATQHQMPLLANLCQDIVTDIEAIKQKHEQVEHVADQDLLDQFFADINGTTASSKDDGNKTEPPIVDSSASVHGQQNIGGSVLENPLPIQEHKRDPLHDQLRNAASTIVSAGGAVSSGNNQSNNSVDPATLEANKKQKHEKEAISY